LGFVAMVCIACAEQPKYELIKHSKSFICWLIRN
jgi:hypothetical protein